MPPRKKARTAANAAPAEMIGQFPKAMLDRLHKTRVIAGFSVDKVTCSLGHGVTLSAPRAKRARVEPRGDKSAPKEAQGAQAALSAQPLRALQQLFLFVPQQRAQSH